MTKREKRLAQMVNNPRTVRPEDLEAVLLDAGFAKRSGKGDHVIFTKGETTLSVDYRQPYLLTVYVRRALAMITKEDANDEGR
jgi:hypothetical protein